LTTIRKSETAKVAAAMAEIVLKAKFRMGAKL